MEDFGRARVICMIPALREESFFQWCWQRQKMYSVVIYSVSTVNHARSRGLWVTCGCLLGQHREAHREAHHETHDSVIWCSTATQALWQMNFMAEKLPCEVPLKFLSHCDCLSHLGRNSRWQLFKYTPQGNVLLIVSQSVGVVMRYVSRVTQIIGSRRREVKRMKCSTKRCVTEKHPIVWLPTTSIVRLHKNEEEWMNQMETMLPKISSSPAVVRLTNNQRELLAILQAIIIIMMMVVNEESVVIITILCNVTLR